MVFHWNLRDSKSPQISRTLLSILVVSIMLQFGWSPLVFQLRSPPVPWIIFEADDKCVMYSVIISSLPAFSLSHTRTHTYLYQMFCHKFYRLCNFFYFSHIRVFFFYFFVPHNQNWIVYFFHLSWRLGVKFRYMLSCHIRLILQILLSFKMTLQNVIVNSLNYIVIITEKSWRYFDFCRSERKTLSYICWRFLLLLFCFLHYPCLILF